MFAMKRQPAEEPDNADVMAICEKLNLPVRPASLQLAETNLRKLRQEHQEAAAECGQCLHADWERDAQRLSTDSRLAQAKVDEINLRIKAARAVVDQERQKWQPKFREELAVPIAAATEMLQLELARIDLLSKAILNVHTFATYCGIETPVARAPALIGAVQSLRAALNQYGY